MQERVSAQVVGGLVLLKNKCMAVDTCHCVSDTYRREVDIPFRLDSNPHLRDSMGVGTDDQ